MPGERLSMRKIRELLRLRWEQHLSQRVIGQSLRLSQAAVSEYLSRARRADLTWPLPDDLDDARLEALLFPPAPNVPTEQRPVPDWAVVHRELRRPNVTLALLWEEYRGGTGARDGFGYSWFCDLYREWVGRLKPTLRQVHTAGERVFVDFAGHTMEVIDGATGEIHRAEVFVAVLGASSYVFAQATWTQSLPDWIAAHVNMLAAIGGVPRQIVSDNLRAGITRACFYEPLVNRTYADMASHYGTAVIPARPYKPRDKAKVEVGVQVVQRWILARLRNRRFFSLAELNQAIRELVDDLNDRPMRGWGTTRRALYEQLDRPALRELPPTPYEYADLEALPGEPRLPRRDRQALLFGAVPAAPRRGRGAHHGEDGGDLPPRQAGGDASAQPAPVSADHARRPHAEFAPALPRLDARTDPARGRSDRRRHRGAGRDHPALTPASRAGVPLLHRHPPAGETLRRRAAGCRLRTGAGPGHPLLQLGRGDPEECSGQEGRRSGTAKPVPREHPRFWLLPLKGKTMLIHPLAERLRGLGMAAMADAFLEMQTNSAAAELSREDWLGLLLDREVTARDNKRLAPTAQPGAIASGRGGRGHRLPHTARSGPRPVPQTRWL